MFDIVFSTRPKYISLKNIYFLVYMYISRRAFRRAHALDVVFYNRSQRRVHLRMCEENAAKRLKLQRDASLTALHARGANAGTVASVLDALTSQKLLANDSNVRKLRYDERKDLGKWQRYTTTLQLQQVDGSIFPWVTSTPHQVLQFFLDHSPSFASLIRLIPQGRAARVIGYNDEITPGDVLHPDPRRKCTCFYISTLDWADHLHNEQAWLPVAVLRSEILKTTQGGLSGAIRTLFESWLACFRGSSLKVCGETIWFPISLDALIFDEAAMHQTWSVKGSSGRRPCLLCKDCVSKPVGNRIDGSSWFKSIKETNILSFTALTDQDAWECVDFLKDRSSTVGKGKFEDLQSNCGFTFNVHGLLHDVPLRQYVRPSATCFDVLHTYFSNGICAVETFLFKEIIEQENFSLVDACELSCQSTHGTKASMRRTLTEPFFGKGTWKASGSAQLNVLPLLHFWLVATIRNTAKWNVACESYKLLLERIYCLLMLTFTKTNQWCDLLEEKQRLHFEAFQKAYSQTHIKPKHHYAMHVTGQWKRFRTMLDTKTMERKHRLAKTEIESSLQNLENFEARLLHRLHVVQEHEVTKHGLVYWEPHLIEPICTAPDRWTSQKALFHGALWSQSEPIVGSDLTWAGLVESFVRIGQNFYLDVAHFESLQPITFGIYEWKKTKHRKLIPWQTPMKRPQSWKLASDSMVTMW